MCITMAPSSLANSRRHRVDSSDDDESSNSPERTKDFYKGPETFKIGHFRVRCFFSTLRFAWYVYFKKKLIFNDSNLLVKDSHFSFPASDIHFVQTAIREIVQDMLLISAGLEEDRALYSEPPEAYRDVSFWQRSFCKKSPSGAITLRGFSDNSNALSIRMLCPKNSAHANWLGSSATLPLVQALEFAQLLEGFNRFILKSDTEHYRQILENKGKQLIVTRPSPTLNDLKEFSHLPIGESSPITSIDERLYFSNPDEEAAARLADEQLLTLSMRESSIRDQAKVAKQVAEEIAGPSSHQHI